MIVRALLVTALVVTSAACSSTSNGTPAASGLVAALGHVADTANTRAQLSYSRPKAAIAADRGERLGVYQRAVGSGGSSLAYAAGVREVLGVNLVSAETSVVAGTPPNDGVRLDGLDVSGLSSAATGLGASKSRTGTTTVYRFRPDNRVDLNDRLGKVLPQTVNDFNVLGVQGNTLRYGPNLAAIEQLDAPNGRTLADNRSVAAVASCLGDPLAAVLADADHAGRSVPASVTEIGVALSGTRGTAPTETLCVATGSQQGANDLAGAVRAAARNGSSLLTRGLWSTIIDDVHISELDGAVVKLTAHPVRNIGGVLLLALAAGDISSLLHRP